MEGFGIGSYDDGYPMDDPDVLAAVKRVAETGTPETVEWGPGVEIDRVADAAWNRKIERMLDAGLGMKPLRLARRGRDRRTRTLKEDRP